MTARQIRRAAERNARKQAPTQSPERSEGLVSPAQLAANRVNSHLSTGPITPEGKAKSSLDAVKTALTGRTVLLPTDDAARYENHVRNFIQELQPVGLREAVLVQSLADTTWRLDRIPGLEMAIYARGRTEFASQFEHEDPALRPGLIELETYLAYEKQLRNLHLQEMRLRRQREKDTAELRQLQQQRIQQEKEALETAAPAQFGFDFSVPSLEPQQPRTQTPNLVFQLQRPGASFTQPGASPA